MMFKHNVLKIVASIPKGKLASYGQVAAMAGSARAARQVGWILHAFDGSYDLPWWRVVNNAGRISIKRNAYSTGQLQKQLLESEGIAITEDLTMDIEQYRYAPSIQAVQKLLS